MWQKLKMWPLWVKIVAAPVGLVVLFTMYVGALKIYDDLYFGYGSLRVQETVRQLEEAGRERRERQMADSYGGKTPQETLQLYIDAVEKGDYELASKYFIEEKRENELTALNKSILAERLQRYISDLKEEVKHECNYSENRKACSIYKPVFVEFILYPNNIWKLVEI